MVEVLVLACPDALAGYTLDTDTSSDGVSVVLSQYLD